MVEPLVSHDFEKAEEFIAALYSTHRRWEPYPGDWAFRGLWDKNFKLLPKAFRAEAWTPFASPGNPPFDPEAASSVVQAQREYQVLKLYFKSLDRAGLDIPNEIFVQQMFDSAGIGGTPSYDHKEFLLDRAIVTFAALAQHHGIPTRLLDWTQSALVAAYFAAVDAAPHATEAGSLCVWALVRPFVGHLKMLRDNLGRIPVPDLRELSAPRASNPNLRAQSGSFTVWFTSKPEPMDAVVPQILAALPAGNLGQWNVTPLQRLTLPWAEAPKLLRMLSQQQVDAMHLFPGRDGVVQFMKERRLWDRDNEAFE